MLVGILSIAYILVSLALMLIILVQRGEGGGLGGAFGQGGAEAAFGARADTSFKKATAILAIIFMFCSIFLGFLMSPEPIVVGPKADKEKKQ